MKALDEFLDVAAVGVGHDPFDVHVGIDLAELPFRRHRLGQALSARRPRQKAFGAGDSIPPRNRDPQCAPSPRPRAPKHWPAPSPAPRSRESPLSIAAASACPSAPMGEKRICREYFSRFMKTYLFTGIRSAWGIPLSSVARTALCVPASCARWPSVVCFAVLTQRGRCVMS